MVSNLLVLFLISPLSWNLELGPNQEVKTLEFFFCPHPHPDPRPSSALVGDREAVGVCSVELRQQLVERLRQRHLAGERTQDVCV